jgi:hypothetical protein
MGGAAALGLLGRGRLAAGLSAGCVTAGVSLALIAVWPLPGVAFALLCVLGVGYALIEVAGLTLMQRLAADDVLARAFGVVETSYYVTTGVGSAIAPVVAGALGVKGALVAVGSCLPLLVLARWRALARFEAGHAVPERPFELLRGIPLFAPLPIATVETLALRLQPVAAGAGEVIIREGEAAESFYVIDDGTVEILEDGISRRTEGPGEFFGEIALLRDVPRTATVRATVPTSLFALGRDAFVESVTGHPRSSQAAEDVIDARLTKQLV